ncbi:MAG: SDR family oxidoreductase [Actinobacteria bacterium]|nr:SDR family oxidoreductase [Actinomycetota bacterium]
MNLDGQVAIVTGGARGIGFATARRLVAAGAKILLSDIDAAELAKAKDELVGEVEIVDGDLTEPSAPATLVERAIERWGQIDIVFNNAGYNWDAPLVEITDQQIQVMFDIHVIAPMRLLRAVGPHFKERAEAEGDAGGQRKVINSSSISGTMGNPNQSNYNAAKAAVVGLTKGLAKEWGEWRVNVNAIAPGFIETRLTALKGEAGSAIVDGKEIELGISAEHRANGSDQVPLGRPGTTEEVAGLVAFLASPASNYINGQVISVNGGVMLGMES